eukprot:403360513
MRKQLHIYPTLLVLSYLGVLQSIKSQLLNTQQKRFVVKKLRYIYKDIQYTIDMDSLTSFDIQKLKIAQYRQLSQLQNFQNDLHQFLRSQQTFEYIVYDIQDTHLTTLKEFEQFKTLYEQRKSKASASQSNNTEVSNSSIKEICHYITSPKFDFYPLKHPEYTQKKITLYFSKIDENWEFQQWDGINIVKLMQFMFDPGFNQYFEVVRTVFYKCNLVIDNFFFYRVLNVSQVKLLSSTINCWKLKEKFDKIESLTQVDGSCLIQNTQKKLFKDVKRLILIENTEKVIAQKYPNIEYLYIND